MGIFMQHSKTFGLISPFVGNGRNTGSDNWELLPHMVATITFIALGILPVLDANQ